MKPPLILLFAALISSCASVQQSVQTLKTRTDSAVKNLKGKSLAVFQKKDRLKIVEPNPSRYIPTLEASKANRLDPVFVKNLTRKTNKRSAPSNIPIENELLAPLPDAELPPLPEAAELRDDSFPSILPSLDEPLPKFEEEAA